MSNVLNMRISEDTKDQLERLCKLTKRTKSSLGAEAIEEFIERKLWLLTALEEGIEDAKKGNLVKHETILDEWEGKAGAA